jgi:hypothetical protein
MPGFLLSEVIVKKSELIAHLQNEIEKFGDGHVLSYKIVDVSGGISGFLYSPTRKLKNGQRAKMNMKEFRDFVIDQRIKEENEGNNVS